MMTCSAGCPALHALDTVAPSLTCFPYLPFLPFQPFMRSLSPDPTAPANQHTCTHRHLHTRTHMHKHHPHPPPHLQAWPACWPCYCSRRKAWLLAIASSSAGPTRLQDASMPRWRTQAPSTVRRHYGSPLRARALREPACRPPPVYMHHLPCVCTCPAAYFHQPRPRIPTFPLTCYAGLVVSIVHEDDCVPRLCKSSLADVLVQALALPTSRVMEAMAVLGKGLVLRLWQFAMERQGSGVMKKTARLALSTEWQGSGAVLKAAGLALGKSYDPRVPGEIVLVAHKASVASAPCTGSDHHTQLLVPCEHDALLKLRTTRRFMKDHSVTQALLTPSPGQPS